MNNSIISNLLAHPGILYTIILVEPFVESIFPIGFLFPGTTFLFFVGYLCSTGKVSVVSALSTLIIAGTLGAMTSFYLGRLGKRSLKFLENPKLAERLRRAELFFEKYGIFGIAIYRFVGPLRSLIPFTAGFLRMKIQKFVPIDLLGNLFSSSIYLLAGFYFVGNLDSLIHIISVYQGIVFGWF